jgi:S1-C subfamily serine protease
VQCRGLSATPAAYEVASFSRRLLLETSLISALLDSPAGAAEATRDAAPDVARQIAAATPEIARAAPLRDAELAIIRVFEQNTRSVANIFDLSLQGRAAQVQAVDVPEGNGSGFVWSQDGYIVTNYHVLGNILQGLGPNVKNRKDVKVWHLYSSDVRLLLCGVGVVGLIGASLKQMAHRRMVGRLMHDW